MSRCTSINHLEVHHKRRDCGNGINNAQVLCHDCHKNTNTYWLQGNSPPAFTEETKQAAKIRAGNQCECVEENCHIDDKMLKEAV